VPKIEQKLERIDQAIKALTSLGAPFEEVLPSGDTADRLFRDKRDEP
jgi:hypothetical protein